MVMLLIDVDITYLVKESFQFKGHLTPIFYFTQSINSNKHNNGRGSVNSDTIYDILRKAIIVNLTHTHNDVILLH